MEVRKRIDYIWNDEETPVAERHRMITDAELDELDNGRSSAAESRLGITIPPSLKVQMILQDGGMIGGGILWRSSVSLDALG